MSGPTGRCSAELSAALGHETGISSQPKAFAALTDAVGFYAGINDAEIGGRGVRWQERASRAEPAPDRTGGSAPSARPRNRPGGLGEPAPTPATAPARFGPRHLPRPLGGPDHRAQPAACLPRTRAAARALAPPMPSASALEAARRSRSARTARASAPGSRSGSGSARALLLDRGDRRGQRQRPAERRAVAVEITQVAR